MPKKKNPFKFVAEVLIRGKQPYIPIRKKHIGKGKLQPHKEYIFSAEPLVDEDEDILI